MKVKPKMVSLMEKEFFITKMAINMKVKLQMDKKMEKAHILRRMDLSQRATGSIIKDMGERYNNIKMEINLSGNIKMG